MTVEGEETYSLRQYLLMKQMRRGVDWMLAQEAVSTMALAHPEMDMEERKTFMEWEDSERG